MSASIKDAANAAIFQIPNNFAPAWRGGKGGPKGMHLSLDFSTDSEIDLDLFARVSALDLEFVQSMYVDNADNTAALIFTFQGLQQRVKVPASAQGVFPIIAPKTNPKIKVSTTPGVVIDVQLLNVPMAYAIWGEAVTIPPVTVGVITGIMTDFSGTIAVGGTSQAAIPANVNRKRAIIQAAPGNVDSLFVDFGAAAASATGIEIPPGSAFDTLAGPLSTAAINIIGAAGGEAYKAKEIA